MKCAYCKYNDGAVYTSIPPKYRCTITNEFHLALDDCNVEFAPVKHGRWTGTNRNRYNDDEATCSICGATFASGYSNPSWWDYCPNCGARMDEVENG